MDGHDERRRGRSGARKVVQWRTSSPARAAAEAERVPERVAADRREPARCRRRRRRRARGPGGPGARRAGRARGAPCPRASARAAWCRSRPSCRVRPAAPPRAARGSGAARPRGRRRASGGRRARRRASAPSRTAPRRRTAQTTIRSVPGREPLPHRLGVAGEVVRRAGRPAAPARRTRPVSSASSRAAARSGSSPHSTPPATRCQ